MTAICKISKVDLLSEIIKKLRKPEHFKKIGRKESLFFVPVRFWTFYFD